MDVALPPICLLPPSRLSDVRGWQEHIPFAFWLTERLRPNRFVELGTHRGDSYCAFCQAVDRLRLPTRCHAIDTWRGDSHSSLYGPEILAELKGYHDPKYAGFSELIRSTFDDALGRFADGSIDLLHIDGFHTYSAVKHDFETWLPKLSRRGVVLMHDTHELAQPTFGVWRYWDEVRQKYPHFQFRHGHGLGVLAVGPESRPLLADLTDASDERAELVRGVFAALGARVRLQGELSATKQDLQSAAKRELDLRVQLVRAERRGDDLDSTVRAMRHTWSWRIGRAVTSPARALRRTA